MMVNAGADDVICSVVHQRHMGQGGVGAVAVYGATLSRQVMAECAVQDLDTSCGPVNCAALKLGGNCR